MKSILQRTFIIGLAIAISLVVAEALLRSRLLTVEPKQSANVLDYGGLVGIDIRTHHPGPGGFLTPAFNGLVVGPYGEPVRWVTNSTGFRYQHELAPTRGAKHRILSLGDSFAVGYRLGQEQTYSALIEKELTRSGIALEMPIALTEEPTSALYYYQTQGRAFSPDVDMPQIKCYREVRIAGHRVIR